MEHYRASRFKVGFTTLYECISKKTLFQGQYKKPYIKVRRPQDLKLSTSIKHHVSLWSAIHRVSLKSAPLLDENVLLGRYSSGQYKKSDIKVWRPWGLLLIVVS